jgi:hypothetical protein
MGCEEDEEGTVQHVVGNPTPITFQATEEATMFVNEDLQSFHVSLPGTKETRYKTIVFPIGKRLATKGDITKKTKRDHVA